MLAAPVHAQSNATWTIARVGGPEVTVIADGIAADGAPVVNLALITMVLGLTVASRNGSVWIHNESGMEWRVAPGAAIGNGRDDGLVTDAVIRDGAVFVPVTTAARLARHRAVIADSNRVYLFPQQPRGVMSPAQPAGWSELRLAKTAEELAETRRIEGTHAPDAPPRTSSTHIFLPPAHEWLRVQTGFGYVAGQDWAATFDTTGSIDGFSITGNAFLTRGSQGLRYMYGRSLVEAPERRWSLEMGDLFGELRGLTQGARVTLAPGGRWSPSLGVYMRDAAQAYPHVLAYRDRLALTSHLETGLEATTDGSVFLRSTLAGTRGHVEGFFRADRIRDVQDRGVTTSLVVWRGASVFAAGRISRGRTADVWTRAGVTLPLTRYAHVTVDQTRARVGHTDTVTHSASLHLPFGPVQVFQRYQTADSAFIDGSGVDLSYRQLQSTASYSASPRLRFAYQAGTQWHRGGGIRPFSELQTSVTLSSATALRITSGVRSPFDPQRLAVRLTHDASKSITVSVEYGRVSTFQPVDGDADARRLLLSIVRTWGMRTPARGGRVSGRVVDGMGRAVAGTGVQLGPYRVRSATDGSYSFAHVPAGSYRLALDPDSLPASHAPAQEDITLDVAAGHDAIRVLQTAALGTIAGRVYVDRNRNHRIDAGEPLAGAVLSVGDRATATDEDGRFSFHNLPPGRHRVELDGSRLRRDLTPASATAVEIDAVQPAQPVDFRLLPREVPVRMQEWP